MTKTSIQVSTKTRDTLESLKKTEDSTYEDVLKGLLPEGVNPENYTRINKEKPAFEWTVGFANNHTQDESVKVSYSDLKESEVGEEWELSGTWEWHEARVIFKDQNGCLVRFGESRHGWGEMEYYLEYFQFL